MSIGSDYAQPVTVNGYTCKNCTDVDYAKKHIDPAHPKSGPYGVDAASDPSRQNAVQFGGNLSGSNTGASSSSSTQTTQQQSAVGQSLNITA